MNWEKIKEQYTPYVFRLSTIKFAYDYMRPYQYPSTNEKHTSTGFYIGDGLLVTNAHVCENCLSIIGENDELKVDLQVQYICKERDIGLLYSEQLLKFFKKHEGATLYHKNGFFIDIPMEIMVLGYPLGHRTIKSTVGVISGWYSNIDDTISMYKSPTIEYSPSYMSNDAASAHGSSGSIVLNTDGEVIGISSAGEEEEAPTMQYALPIEYVKLLLDYIKVERATTATTAKVIRWPKYSFDFFPTSEDLFHGKGIYIKKINRDSFLRYLKEGDVLLSLYLQSKKIKAIVASSGELEVYVGEQFLRRMTLKEWFQSLPYGSSLQLQVQRKNKILTLNEDYRIPKEFDTFVPYVVPSLEPHTLEYRCFGPLILMDAIYNAYMEYASECNTPPSKNGTGRTQDIQRERGVMIAQILPPSELFDMQLFQEGQYLTKINNQKITCLKDLELLKMYDDHIMLQNDQDDFYICSLEKWEKDSGRFRNTYPFYRNSQYLCPKT